MKQFFCFLITIFTGIAVVQACEKVKACSKPPIDTAAKKTTAKASPVVQPSPKQTSKKEEKKPEGDIVTPLSWRPSLLY